MVAPHFFTAIGANDEQRLGWLKAKQEAQPFQRVTVTPLQVIDNEKARLLLGAKNARQRFMEKASLGAVQQGGRRCDLGEGRQ